MAPETRLTPRLRITGRPIRARFEVVFQDCSVALSGTSFFYLFQLCYWAVRKPGHWMSKEDIEDTENQARYIYRLRREIAVSLGTVPDLIENNREGAYRLKVRPQKLSFDLVSLRTHPDARVRKRAAHLVSTGSLREDYRSV